MEIEINPKVKNNRDSLAINRILPFSTCGMPDIESVNGKFIHDNLQGLLKEMLLNSFQRSFIFLAALDSPLDSPDTLGQRKGMSTKRQGKEIEKR